MTTDNPRALKLKKHLDSIIYERGTLTRTNNALFIEAICAVPDPATCVNKLIASPEGLKSLQASVRFDLSPGFINNSASALLQYIAAPAVAEISSGSFLRQLLVSIVEPPIFWTAFINAFKAGQLRENAQQSFAWLMLQLISFPREASSSYRETANDPEILNALLSSPNIDIRTIAQKIQHILSTCSLGSHIDLEYGPGGRHDNDFPDFHKIAILPTADELVCKEPPFLRPVAMMEGPDVEANQIATHLDNQFRLLRDDMLHEMREELQILLGLKKGKRGFGLKVEGLTLRDISLKNPRNNRACKWGIVMECHIDPFPNMKPSKRRTYLNDKPKFFRHQSMTCLIVDNEIVGFPTIYRVEDLLVQQPSKLVLQLEGQQSTVKTLLKIYDAQRIRLLPIDTAIFSYEPVLKALQDKQILPLSQELLFWTEGDSLNAPLNQPTRLVNAIKADPCQDLQALLKTSRPIKLDNAQANSLISGLTQQVSLIQGPPGTGKSFIGALLAKALHDLEKHTILVVCYTNHALDQFLEDLLDIGIPKTSMVRLGGKSTPRTEDLSLQNQARNSKFGKADWKIIDLIKSTSNMYSYRLTRAFEKYRGFNSKNKMANILDYLEFEHSDYFDAFQVPEVADGMQRVGKKGHAVRKDYLIFQWSRGFGPGMFKNAENVIQASEIWSMPHDTRQTHFSRWIQAMLKEIVDEIYEHGKKYNDCQKELDRKFREADASVLRSKRIIGCTTTAAAMYREEISTANPGVLLVEEAGEILESHILTALGAETKQLILIGDHKQLRPKVNKYKLTIEKGEGFDLNRSLFERLVLKGYPHETLRVQHRMRPEISNLVRHLTYPELLDDPKTQGRPDLRGVRNNVVFINHEQPEDEYSEIEERGDIGAKASKRNKFEVQMILKTVRYLAQQGYGTDTMVVLTPYLGQLRELQEALKKDNDPVLNDLDSFDLVRAGLLSSSAANVNKKRIRIATIDNYQGEESDIVIVSLTRSNPDYEIGFMTSPERLTVMLSRARNAFIMIGNSYTFMNARKGRDTWVKLFDILKNKGYIYDGLPVKCERHVNRQALLKCPDDFDKECPDGGCLEPCQTMLNCNLHRCPSKCHQLYDHSNMLCDYIMYSRCSKGHPQQWKCHKKGPPASCTKCDREQKATEKRRKEEYERQEKRDEEQRIHAQRLAELEDQITNGRNVLRDAQLVDERNNAILQKEKELKDTLALACLATSSNPTPSPPLDAALPTEPNIERQSPNDPTQSKVDDLPKPLRKSTTNLSDIHIKAHLESNARDDWEKRKDLAGEHNDAIDAIMKMTGLEDVKTQVLKVMDKVNIAKRQGSDLKNERFNISMLGNPGTGKTTVARHYGKFLASVQIIPVDMFVETTGSRLAQDGVPGIEKLIEQVINAGGGTIFVDEAYQLTSQHNFQGKQVLDFLLAEMENKLGKIAFIFAGYNKEMEKFFEHNPGLTSRVPYSLQFKDYEDDELLSMLESSIKETWKGMMKVDDGIRGLYGRIAIRRLGRGRGRDGFGNARSLANMFAKIRERQAERISKEARQGLQPDNFLLVKEDLIGPHPSKVMKESIAWKKLQSMIGLGAVKNSVTNLFSMVDTNYQRELLEKAPHQISLNRVFLGSPGTGKTTVAKHYGRILADLGLISNGEVITKNPADFIGSALGQSESQTKAILANTTGKVLIIDEAYMLYGGSDNGGSPDPYKTAVIDTIVAEVQSVPGEDRCVLMLGYKQQIEEMFQNVNPGLARRFSIGDAFHFHDYTDSELLQALDLKLQDQDLTATDAAKAVAIDVLGRARNRPNFGNIGEVENLLSQAKIRYQERQTSLPTEVRSPDAPFEPTDFDPEFDRGKHAASNLTKLFEDVVGCEDIVKKLEEWQQLAQNPNTPRDIIPTNFVFKGPPGTGKTTTARKMGQVYYNMKFLSSTEVIECSASDLVGQYVGQTGPKTKKLLEKARGRVLFIDEAYRLSDGHFAKEAVDELVSIMTRDEYKGKIVVILAGYDQEMNELMAMNTGLSSRFREEIVFRNMLPEQCLQVLKKKLKKMNIHISTSEDPLCSDYQTMLKLFAQISGLPSWGNARDIETLSKQIAKKVFATLPPSSSIAGDNSDGVMTLSGGKVIECIRSMLEEHRERASNTPVRPDQFGAPRQPEAPLAPPVRTTQSTFQSTAPPSIVQDELGDQSCNPTQPRDPGVTDGVWGQLFRDRQVAEDHMRCFEEAQQTLERDLREAEDHQEAHREVARRLAEAEASDASERAELMRQREAARLREVAAQEECARKAAALEEVKRERHKEAQVQAKIRGMGVCLAGFRWIKQASGYRCAGGSHFIDNAALD